MARFNLKASSLSDLKVRLLPELAKKDGVEVGKVKSLGVRVLDDWPEQPFKDQVGHTCGLYALRNVMRYQFRVLAKTEGDQAALARAPQMAARKLEVRNTQDSETGDPAGLWVPGGVSLRELAKAGQLTGVGELLDARYVARLARKLGYEGVAKRCVNDHYMTTLKQAIHAGVPPIVSVDVGNDSTNSGNAVKLGGLHGHWVLAFGYQTIETPVKTRDMVFIMHWGNYYAYSLRTLQRSSNQLQRFPAGTLTKTGKKWDWTRDPTYSTTAAAVKPDHSNYVRTAHGRVTGLDLSDISDSLNGAIVEVKPPAKAVNTFLEDVKRACEAYQKHRSKVFHWSSDASKNAQQVLEGMVKKQLGLTDLLDAVLYYTGQAGSRNAKTLGSQLKSDSTLCTLLKEAYDRWLKWVPPDA